ncbi:Aldehyde dehydrogenase 12 [Hyphodiscus hymeniophilus]|uniref:Aldehyde dehydrogenase 12 n=1 Tax=Hyphodiscus hymeniophilus TaxID=353542 RepID=A0A9P6VCB2_9HELO|nr:Aldehyde dehydrogenase 12 [Hyphodiscus hymeniophilus]
MKSTQSPQCEAITALWSCNSIEKAKSYLGAIRGASQITISNYVGEAFISKTADSYIDSFEPKTGNLYCKVPLTSAQDVDAAISCAKDAFKTWSKTARAVRSRYLQRIASLIEENRELFAVWESIDQGKTLARARIEVDRAISNFSYFSTFILHEETKARMIDGVALTYEHRSPAGVFALISPWNMPLYLLTWKIAPCIAFGCTAVAKPSEVTSMSAFLLCEVLRQAELPSGVVNIVFGNGAVTGSALVKSQKIAGVSFTGGTATGIQIRKDTATDVYKHLSLELGGKNPTLVFDDVDLENAIATAAMAAFENQGEICLCGSRIYVQNTIYEQFVEKFTEYVSGNYQVGKTVGAIVSHPHFQKIVSYLELAKNENATFNLGSIPDKEPKAGYWMDPVILTNLSTDSAVVREEIFGPVVTIAPFTSEEQAIELANDNPNGLASVLLTKDGARMRRVGEQIEAGLVWVNCWLVRELGTPFGGMKNSGTGREGGEFSRDFFTVVRTLHIPSF